MLDSHEWQIVSEAFDECISLPEDKWKDKSFALTGGDKRLATEVLKLLHNSKSAGNWFDNLQDEVAAGIHDGLKPPECVAGDVIDKFKVVRELGRGGMASVYLADRNDGQFEQKVAIKLLAPDFFEKKFEKRYHLEQQILAGLNHPNIARLYDGGTTPDGVPYIVMEYVEGLPVDTYCEKHKLSVKKRVELFLQVIDAVHYAHRQLVIHRDLKPQNILVTKEGNVKLLDFGIAHILTATEDEKLQAGHFFGTPHYASPEQLKGETPGITSDIFQLGLIFYNIFTGNNARSTEEPKTMLYTTGNHTITSHYQPISNYIIDAGFHDRSSDLKAITAKCLQEKPEDRYDTAHALKDDFLAFLQFKPVIARNGNAKYLLRRYLRRNRTAVLLVFLLFSTMLAGIFATRHQANQALKEKEKAEQVAFFIKEIFEASDPDVNKGDTISALKLLEGSERKIDQIYGQPELQAEMYNLTGELYAKLGFWDEARGLFQKALMLEHSISGKAHDDFLARVYLNIAGNQRNLSHFEKADSFVNLALDIRNNMRGGNSADVAVALKEKAYILNQLSEYEKALAAVDDAITIFEKQNPEGYYEELSDCYNYKASILRETAQFEEAIDAQERSLALAYENFNGEINTSAAIALNNLAILLNKVGRYQEAIQRYQESYEMTLTLQGPNHPDIPVRLINIAGTYYKLKDYEMADSLNHLAYNKFKDLYGDFHNHTVSSLYNIANLYYSTARYTEAEEYYRKVIEADRKIFGEEHTYLADDYTQLGKLKIELQDYEEAIALFQQAEQIYNKKFPEGHQKVSHLLSTKADMYGKMKRVDKCLEYYDKAIEMASKFLGRDHPYIEDYRTYKQEYIEQFKQEKLLTANN